MYEEKVLGKISNVKFGFVPGSFQVQVKMVAE
jgi:hypothetical protein